MVKANILLLLRIRDVYPRSQILIFTHPGSQIQEKQQREGCGHKFPKI